MPKKNSRQDFSIKPRPLEKIIVSASSAIQRQPKVGGRVPKRILIVDEPLVYGLRLHIDLVRQAAQKSISPKLDSAGVAGHFVSPSKSAN